MQLPASLAPRPKGSQPAPMSAMRSRAAAWVLMQLKPGSCAAPRPDREANPLPVPPQVMRDKLLAGAEGSARDNAAIAGHWAELYALEVPQELQGEMHAQQAACAAIVQAKGGLVEEMKGELKGKDDEYVRTLKQQAEDVDLLLQYMSTQLEEMQTAYREELSEVESAFLQVSDTAWQCRPAAGVVAACSRLHPCSPAGWGQQSVASAGRRPAARSTYGACLLQQSPLYLKGHPQL